MTFQPKNLFLRLISDNVWLVALKMVTTVKPLYSEQSRDRTNCSLYRGVHLRGVRCVHVHMCLQYNVHIKTVPSLQVRDSSGGRAIFHDSFSFFLYFMIFLDFFIRVHVYLID